MAKKRAKSHENGRPMTTSEAEDLYGIHRWGAGYFAVGDDGHLRCHPTKEPDLWIDLFQVIEKLRRKNNAPPIVLRFPQIIATQVRLLHEAFQKSIAEFEYEGVYRGVFPIKVNQLEPFISELVRAGKPWGYGLEAGTKPELAVALSAGLKQGSLIICNGYKDRAYVELALSGIVLGYDVMLIVEKYYELDLILKCARRMGVRPRLGLRLKVAARGTGKWERSGGTASKFGLTTAEILEAVNVCQQKGLGDCIRLLHFHIGSQIIDIQVLKRALKEMTQIYASLHQSRLHCPVGNLLGALIDAQAIEMAARRAKIKDKVLGAHAAWRLLIKGVGDHRSGRTDQPLHRQTEAEHKQTDQLVGTPFHLSAVPCSTSACGYPGELLAE